MASELLVMIALSTWGSRDTCRQTSVDELLGISAGDSLEISAPGFSSSFLGFLDILCPGGSTSGDSSSTFGCLDPFFLGSSSFFFGFLPAGTYTSQAPETGQWISSCPKTHCEHLALHWRHKNSTLLWEDKNTSLLLELDHLVIPFLSSLAEEYFLLLSSSLWRNIFFSFFFLTSGASSGASTGSRGTSCDSSSTGSGTSSSSSSSSVQEDLEASLQFSMSRDLGSQDWLWRWREKE